jgi:hypothetical protein
VSSTSDRSAGESIPVFSPGSWQEGIPFLSAFAASEARGRGGCQATYDLPACPRWYKKANLYLSAYNLLNTNYYNPAGLTGYGSNPEMLFVYPGEPVNIFAGAQFTF